MKKNFFILTIIAFTGIFIFNSCKKEKSCEGCRENNKPPTAIAGPDQVITLPTDSISLDGSASNDSDGTISAWLWIKISGPASFTIVNTTVAKTVSKSLVAGTYKFELTVTDDKGASAKDTMQVIVNDPSQPNRPPVADAGIDQTITLPTNSITVDGSGSTDPDNNITNYQWTKISGPSSFNIGNANTVTTKVNNLVEGVYQFELKVTDAGGLFSKDTVQVAFNSAVVVDCNGIVRPQINAQLIPIGTLSQARHSMVVASTSNKILYAGGSAGSNPVSYLSTVDIFDITANSWTTAQFSGEPRRNIATAVLGNKIFFAGGWYQNGYGSSRVDIYDAVANTWTTAELSVARGGIASAAAGNKVLFAGGWNWDNDPSAIPNPTTVDIYDASTNSWSTSILTGRDWATGGIATTVIGNKIYFAGGSDFDGGNTISTINIYDASANTWSTSALNKARGHMAGIAVGSKNYWAGGYESGLFTDQVEIRDMNSGSSELTCLFQPNAAYWSQPNASFSTVLKDNKIVFFTGRGNVKNKFDIYDITSNTWSTGVLPVNIVAASIITTNNTIYVAGGYVNDVLSNQVWKLEL
jgi:hypothetical protein